MKDKQDKKIKLSKMGEAALKWQRQGYAVLPIRPDTKKPYIKWKHGDIDYQAEKPTKEQIKDWWT